MTAFYRFAANTLIASVTGTLVWFGLSIWIYLVTKSVFVTSLLSALYTGALILTGFSFGALVDRHRKRVVMLWSDILSLAFQAIGLAVYTGMDASGTLTTSDWRLWLLTGAVFASVIIGTIRGIAMAAMTTLLVGEPHRDRANGIVGTANGIAYLVAPMAGGFLLSIAGLYWILVAGMVLRFLTAVDLLSITAPQDTAGPHEDSHPFSHIGATLRIIGAIPGFTGLLVFNSINNFLGGVFMPLVDPYGLSLVSQRTWGILTGIYSLGFIVSGLFISRYGIGKNPIRTVFITNIIMWIVCILFTLQPSIVLFSAGVILFFASVPFVEAAEQTVVQKLTPKRHQGKVFGFQQSVEAAATPLSTLATGPIAQFVFIPFMTTGWGAAMIGPWYGTGDARGIGLLFSTAGLAGLILTLVAMRTSSYRALSSAAMDRGDR